MRTAALSRVSDKKEDLHQIFIGILPRGLACWSTGGKQNHGVNFYCKDGQIGPCTKEQTAVTISPTPLTPPTPSNSQPTWRHNTHRRQHAKRSRQHSHVRRRLAALLPFPALVRHSHRRSRSLPTAVYRKLRNTPLELKQHQLIVGFLDV